MRQGGNVKIPQEASWAAIEIASMKEGAAQTRKSPEGVIISGSFFEVQKTLDWGEEKNHKKNWSGPLCESRATVAQRAVWKEI